MKIYWNKIRKLAVALIILVILIIFFIVIANRNDKETIKEEYNEKTVQEDGIIDSDNENEKGVQFIQ